MGIKLICRLVVTRVSDYVNSVDIQVVQDDDNCCGSLTEDDHQLFVMMILQPSDSTRLVTWEADDLITNF